ncbi:MAG: GDP-mannose 4,6-dehydratase [Verrucomicrobiota bacterium]
MENVAFITGITGQDGSYLTELLLDKEYAVHGLVHRPDRLATGNIGHLISDDSIYNKKLFIHHGSFEDTTHLRRLIAKVRPTEFYHLAGQSSPRISLELPEATVESIGMATLKLLEIIRDLPEPPKFLYPSSSEIFGSPTHTPQDELTPLRPTTPYGAAKEFSHQMCSIYRIAYGLKTCSAILYNHESPRRGPQFVTQKIARGVAQIKKGKQRKLTLGALTGRRDWGWAPDYVKGMWLMLQAETVDDFILATGVTHTVKDLVETAFKVLDLNWKDYVEHDPSLIKVVEPNHPCGNPGKAKRILGWENSVPFPLIIEKMVKAELDKLG